MWQPHHREIIFDDKVDETTSRHRRRWPNLFLRAFVFGCRSVTFLSHFAHNKFAVDLLINDSNDVFRTKNEPLRCGVCVYFCSIFVAILSCSLQRAVNLCLGSDTFSKWSRLVFDAVSSHFGEFRESRSGAEENSEKELANLVGLWNAAAFSRQFGPSCIFPTRPFARILRLSDADRTLLLTVSSPRQKYDTVALMLHQNVCVGRRSCECVSEGETIFMKFGHVLHFRVFWFYFWCSTYGIFSKWFVHVFAAWCGTRGDFLCQQHTFTVKQCSANSALDVKEIIHKAFIMCHNFR